MESLLTSSIKGGESSTHSLPLMRANQSQAASSSTVSPYTVGLRSVTQPNVLESAEVFGKSDHTKDESIFNRPPMLPVIASDTKFITSTLEVMDAINYANNAAVRANLLDAIKCWLSHIDEVLSKYEGFEDNWDKVASRSAQVAFPLATTPDARHLDPRQLLWELRMLEIDMSFHDQFSSLPLLACIRVLKQIRDAAPLLVQLEQKLAKLKAHQEQINIDISLVETVSQYFFLYAPARSRSPAWPSELAVLNPIVFPEQQRNALEATRERLQREHEKLVAEDERIEKELAIKQQFASTAQSGGALMLTEGPSNGPPTAAAYSPNKKKSTSLVKAKLNPPILSDVWAIEDLSDMLVPLFSAFRALWVCSERFGAKNGKHKRFSSLTRFAIHQVELSVHSACWDSIQRVIDNATAVNITKVKASVVYAQESIVALQEAFYNLKVHLAECGPSLDGFHLVYSDLDDTVIFSNVEWQYRRLTVVLQIIDNLRSNVKKIGSKLTDPFEILSSDGDVMSRFHFPDHRFDACARALLNQDAPDPDLIIQNIVNKESERQKALLDREPRYPLGMLTSHMTIVCSFSPPTVTVVGGPLSHTALDAAQSRLPLCCANKIPDSKSTKMMVEMTFNKVPNPTNQHVSRMVIPEQYCETSLHVTQFVHTILTIVEAELCWSLCGTHALIDPDFGETHYYVFKKVDPLANARTGATQIKELADARAELNALEAAEGGL